MHVGIDARSFADGGSHRTYFTQVIREMARLSPTDRWTLYTDHDDPSLQSLTSANIALAPVLRAPIGALWNVTALVPRLRQDKADLLHAQYLLPPVGSVPCPMVVTIHDATFRLFPEWFPKRANRRQNLLIPIAARRAARIVTCSENSARDIARSMSVPLAKIAVTPYGVDPVYRPAHAEETAAARHHYGLPERYLFGAGILRPRKNAIIVLKAMLELHTQGQWPEDVAFAMTGKLDRIPEVQALVAENPVLRLLVRELGFVADTDLPLLYAGAWASAYPSLYEGFGLPVLEAMASGCPVASSSSSSLPEVTGPGGLQVAPDDLPGWVTALRRLLWDDAERERLRDYGLARARQFTWERTARLTLETYRSLLPPNS